MDTVLFDMDGTLLNTLGDIHASVNFALEQSGLAPVTLNETREAAGYGSIVLIEMVTKGDFAQDSAEFKRVFNDFSNHYAEHCKDSTQPYPGIMELLAALKELGIKMAVVSNKIHHETEALRQSWFAEYIPLAIGRAEDVPAKPDPTMALRALEQLGSTPQSTLFVGDSQPDVQTGKNAQCTSVGCTWGFRSREILEAERADFIIDAPLELLEIVGSGRQ